MSEDPKQQLDKTTKIIGFRVTEEELQNVIYPVMHDCYDLSIIDHDTLTSFLRFCVQFWMGHYRQKKKQQFDMSQQEIEEEKKKLAAIIAEKEAWHKWDNSTPRVMQKTVKELEEMGEQLEREFAETHPPSSPKQQPRKQQPTTASKTIVANLSLEDMMA
jgi:hypothetical protein